MLSLVAIGCLISACVAQSGQPTSGAAGLCEMDIRPGVFENKLVPGGQYIHDTTVYQTAEDCMWSCCDQALAVVSPNQLKCNMAYFYQEPDPYNPDVLRNVCVWWSCKPGECQPNRDVDPDTTARVGFLLPQEPIAQSAGYLDPASGLPGYLDPASGLLGQQAMPGYQAGYHSQDGTHEGMPQYPNSYGTQDQTQKGIPHYPSSYGTQDQTQEGIPQYPSSYETQKGIPQYPSSYETQDQTQEGMPQVPSSYETQKGMPQYPSSYETQEAVPAGGYVQPAPVGGYQEQGMPGPARGGMPSQQTAALPGHEAGSQGTYVYDPQSGRYVFVGEQQSSGLLQDDSQENSALPSDNSDLADENYGLVQQENSSLLQENLTSLEYKDADSPTTTEAFQTTDSQGWSWFNWWNTKDNNDDDDADDDDDDDDFEDDFDDDADYYDDEANVYDDDFGERLFDDDDNSNNNNNETDWNEEEQWEEEEEEKEEEEWQKELEEWEAENEGGQQRPQQLENGEAILKTTTISAEKLAEMEEEAELDDWLDSYENANREGTEDTTSAAGNELEPAIGAGDVYRPETFAETGQSDWTVNTPVIVVGACAAVVLVALLFVLVGRKLAGRTERAQYRPLKESFAGSATYRDEI